VVTGSYGTCASAPGTATPPTSKQSALAELVPTSSAMTSIALLFNYGVIVNGANFRRDGRRG